jgi:CBS domain-containing protein
MQVGEVIQNKADTVFTIIKDAFLGDAARIMKKQGIGALVVITAAGELHGVLSERELVLAFAEFGHRAMDVFVHDVMIVDGPVVTPADHVVDAMKIMTDRQVRHLPVVAARSVVGLLSIDDAVKARLSEKIAENLA